MFTKKERERYNEDRERACKRLGITKNQYNYFRREGEILRKYYEDNCNGLFKKEQDYLDKVEPLEGRIYNRSNLANLFIYFQTDPRGATIYLDTKEIPENNYTQAVCIY
jgi:hypothetical protein